VISATRSGLWQEISSNTAITVKNSGYSLYLISFTVWLGERSAAASTIQQVYAHGFLGGKHAEHRVETSIETWWATASHVSDLSVVPAVLNEKICIKLAKRAADTDY